MALVYLLTFLVILFFIIAFRKNISGLILGILTFVGAIFFTVFMFNVFTPYDLASVIPMGWYKNTVNDPKNTAKELADKSKDVLSSVGTVVNEEGKKVDEKLGIEFDSENKRWKKISTEDLENKSDKEKSKPDSKETKNNENMSSNEDEMFNLVKEGLNSSNTKELEEHKIKLEDVTKYIKENKSFLSEKDISLLKGTSPLLEETLKGDTISIKVDKGYIVISPLDN